MKLDTTAWQNFTAPGWIPRITKFLGCLTVLATLAWLAQRSWQKSLPANKAKWLAANDAAKEVLLLTNKSTFEAKTALKVALDKLEGDPNKVELALEAVARAIKPSPGEMAVKANIAEISELSMYERRAATGRWAFLPHLRQLVFPTI